MGRMMKEGKRGVKILSPGHVHGSEVTWHVAMVTGKGWGGALERRKGDERG